MKFFIIGDSYGCGEWEIKSKSKTMTLVPDTGVDYYLKNLGHDTTNLSAGSACNFGQLRTAYWKLKENCNYDYIIWFHTEPVRDIVEHIIDDPTDGLKQYPNFKNIKDYSVALKYINECNYAFAQDRLYAEFNIPFIVIGGVGRLEDSIDNFTFAKYKIYSWIEELLNINYKLPKNLNGWQRSKEVIDYFDLFDKQSVLDEITQAENYQRLLNLSSLFPDSVHPCREEYETLAYRILNMLQ